MKGKRHIKVSSFSGISEFALDSDRWYSRVYIIVYDKIGSSWKSRRESFYLVTIDSDGCYLYIGNGDSDRLLVDVDRDITSWRSPLHIESIDGL